MPALLNYAPSLTEHKVSAPELVAKIRELVHQGNVRRITITNEKGDGVSFGLRRPRPHA